MARVERPLRGAISALSQAIVVDRPTLAAVFDCTVYGPGGYRELDVLRLSWFIVGAALSHAFATGRSTVAPLVDALESFLGDRALAHTVLACIASQQIHRAEAVLARLEIDEQLLDLLPYVLEPHGHITRNRLETCDIAKQTGSTKVRSQRILRRSQFLTNVFTISLWSSPFLKFGAQ